MSNGTETEAEADIVSAAVDSADGDASAGGGEKVDADLLKRAIFGVPIEVVVSVGTARPLIGELLEMKRNHLLPLDAAIDDPVELRVKDRVIARGDLTEVPDTEGQLAIRLTEVVNIADIMKQ